MEPGTRNLELERASPSQSQAQDGWTSGSVRLVIGTMCHSGHWERIEKIHPLRAALCAEVCARGAGAHGVVT
jgi:hypothetical protein